MVDTGADLNVIKERSVHPDVPISHTESLLLSGITKGTVETLGSIQILLEGHPVTLHLVPNTFPIAQEGILGNDFLEDAKGLDFKRKYLDWHGIRIPLADQETILVPARSQTTFYVKVSNDVNTGYVPLLRAGDDVRLGDALVTNRDGKAYLRAANTGNEDQSVVVPTIELLEVEGVSLGPPETRDQSKAVINIMQCHNKEERAREIKQLLRLDHLNREEAANVEKLIQNHNDLFRLPNDGLSFTTKGHHKIATTDDRPINTKQYRYPVAHKNEIDKQVSELINNGIIRTSTSPYNSPLWIVPKKADSKGNKRWRMVIDYRALNEKTLGDAYPLPNITEILDQLGSAKYFSVFDLASGFHQIPMHEADAPKTAFSTPYGHYEFSRMPFGLKNAPATFQRLMDQVLTGLQGTELFVYLDDIVIYASSLTEHQMKFNKLAERLRKANLKLQPDKCEFLRKEVSYLGHIISEDGVKPDPKKIDAVKNFPRPRNAKNIKQFLGLAGYYRRFIPNFSGTSKPLTLLLTKDEPFVWGNNQEKAFTTLRDQLCSEPLLQYPDFTKPFVITTDASDIAIGGILSQGKIGEDRPIAYASRALSAAEKNYSTIEKELLAIIYCTRHFRPYVYGNSFTLVTDHKPLKWLDSVKDPTSRLMRWRLKLAEYDYQIIYKAGKTNVNADALSRNPVIRQIKMFNSKTPPHSDSSDDESIFSLRKRPKNKTRGNLKERLHNVDNARPPTPDENENSSDNETNESLLSPTNNWVEQTSANESCDDSPHENIISSANDQITPTSADERSDDSTSESDTSDSDNLFDNPNEKYVLRQPVEAQFIETRENFLSIKSNRIIFMTQQGAPCDRGAIILNEANKLPEIKDVSLGRARALLEKNKYYLIALAIKDRVSAIIEKELIREAIGSLMDVTSELGLTNIAISQSDIGSIPWLEIRELISREFKGTDVRITVCTNEIEIPPEHLRSELIKEYHSSSIGGHKGITKTYNRLKTRYTWPGMKRQIEAFINKCQNCQLKKLVRRKVRQPMILTDTPDAAFDKISIDIMGPLPTTRNGHSYILTVQDLLTKYSLAIPLKNAGAIDVADAMVNEYICIYGAPKALLTDQGTHFLNSLMKAIAKKFKIIKYQTTAYRPQANGSVERAHHVLWEYLKQTVEEKTNWDEYLKLANFSYNTSVHEGTKYTPHELVFGKTARIPSGEPYPENNLNESYERYLTNLYYKLRHVQANAREHLQAAKQRYKKYYDRRVNPHEFKNDELVYILKEPTNKLGDQYIGPYRIIELLPNNNVRLDVGRNRHKVVHTDKLKSHKRPTPLPPTSSTAQPGGSSPARADGEET